MNGSCCQTEGHLRNPECVLSVLWGIFTMAFSFFTPFLFGLFSPSTCSSSSFHISLIHHFLLPLLYVVHLPAVLRSRWRVSCRSADTWVVMYLHSVLSLCFILPDNSFPLEMASLSPAVTSFLYIQYMCVHEFSACMPVCLYVGGYTCQLQSFTCPFYPALFICPVIFPPIQLSSFPNPFLLLLSILRR